MDMDGNQNEETQKELPPSVPRRLFKFPTVKLKTS